MAEEKPPPKLAVPRLRVSSYSFNDTSIPNVSHRTVSSSTSLLSTPSNNIRRVQQINQQKANAKHPAGAKQPGSRSRHDAPFQGVSSTAAASKKLLNLQQSKRAPASLRPFVLRKPAALSAYDHSVFVRGPKKAGKSTQLPPVKESQIRAWESAEKISASVIFDNEAAAADDLRIFEDHPQSQPPAGSAAASASPPTETDSHLATAQTLLRSIPNYTKGDLKVILENYRQLETCTEKIDPVVHEDAEKRALWLYRQQQSAAQERAFCANHTLAGKRKVQVFHKKEFLHKLFGYTNTVNQDYITNNTSYSAFDNVSNAQKAFHEDKEEILSLLEEDKMFEQELAEARERFLGADDRSGKPDSLMDAQDLLNMTSSWLTWSYEKQSGMDVDAPETEPDENPEVVAAALGVLKQCVRDAHEIDT